MLSMIVHKLQVVMPVLVIMALSRDSWRCFGIVRPKWIGDALLAVAIWFAGNATYIFVARLLPSSVLHGFRAAHIAYQARPEGLAGFLLLVVTHVAVGFSEELVMRAYLITRLQRLLSSTWLAVVISTALFASWHLYQGATGTISAAADGLVYGIAFCWFRRLWPLCLAHAAHNIWIYL
jgi:membrane protease YdiL (CAAX protease family)